MRDVWASFTELDPAMQKRLAGVLETRGADAQQQALRSIFLSGIAFPQQAEVLEIGCGTGVLARKLARWPNVATVTGTDIAAALVDEARRLAADLDNLSFRVADARELPFEADVFDVVLFDSVLSHVPSPDRAVQEAFRVLRPKGTIAIFDGDYATTTVALREHDPLQACVDAMMAHSVTDRWVMRRMPKLLREAGFLLMRFESHGFAETSAGAYMMSVIDRGADILRVGGMIGEATAEALKAEARQRVEAGSFFGHVAYASVTAAKP